MYNPIDSYSVDHHNKYIRYLGTGRYIYMA